jgi:hypothetical protein
MQSFQVVIKFNCPKMMASEDQNHFVALLSIWDSCRLNCEKECSLS